MGEGAHPFYTNQPGQVPNQIPTGRSASYDDGAKVVHAVQPQMLQELQEAQLAQQRLAPNRVKMTEPAAKKPRTKVLRACDECRWKTLPTVDLRRWIYRVFTPRTS